MAKDNTESFKAKADDGSIWELPYQTVVDDMIAYEEKDDDKWPRPITRDMALQWVSDNADSIKGWTLVSSEKPEASGLLVIQ